MAVFRVEKNKNYTVMSNYHLKDKTLSLKAKGLLSQMLSLPDDWNYTLDGLAQINKEKIDAIRTAVKELESAGYINRTRERDEKGRLGDTIYEIHEQPITAHETDNHQIAANNVAHRAGASGRKRSNLTSAPNISQYRELIHQNINYDLLLSEYDPSEVMEITELIIETVCSNRKTFRIAGSDFPLEVVRSRFLKLEHDHIQYVLDGVSSNTTSIRNMKAYLLASLWNAPLTMNTFNHAKVNYDFSASNL